jgi:uncharacterized RDD family membrane protein YckC
MKNIEILTTQNVVLQYELASFQDRAFAFILDTLFLFFSLLILSAFVGGLFSYGSLLESIAKILLTCLFCMYSLLFDFFNQGRTVGKMIMKIQVIKLAGSYPTFSEYAARWVFRLIDIYFSLGSIASLLIISSSKAQRIGDIIANTAVIKTVPKTNVNLQDILNIHRVDKYIPKYQLAKKLQEEDALLIKTTLERYRRFNNESHREAMYQLAEHVQTMLGIDHIKEDRSVFLQTIFQDYVVLSR